MASSLVLTDADGNLYDPSGKQLAYSDIATLLTPTIGIPRAIADEPDFGGVTVGGSVSGVIDVSGDVDAYSVNLVVGQTYLFSLRGSGATPLSDSLLVLSGPAGNFINFDDDGGNGLFSIITYTATATGIYTLDALAFSNPNDPGVGGYTIDVRVQGADTVGSTIATAGVAGLGTTFGFRETGSDLDRYAITLEAGQYYTFGLAGGADYNTDFEAVPTGELDTILRLRDSTGALLAVNDDISFPGDISSSLGFFAETSGVYYIDALAYGGQTGGYALTVDQVDLSGFDPLTSLDWRSADDVPFVDVGGVPTAYVYFGAAGETFGQTNDDGDAPMVTLGWEQHEIDAVMLALEQYEAILGTNYVITTDVTQATFRLSTTISEAYGAYFFPQDPVFGADQGVGVFNIASGGWTVPASLQQGGYAFSVILHEFGHAHGLAHPHDRGGGSDVMLGVTSAFGSLGVFDLNQGVYTVMSYNDGWVLHPDGPSPYNFAGIGQGWPGTLSALDIAQLQERYGVHAAATGDTVYALDAANVAGTYYQTIWDTGGNDTIRFDGAQATRIDLTAATLDYSATGAGVVSYVDGIWGGFTIANGVVIENATGGGGNDVLIGNSARNILLGNNGDDFLMGGAGADTLNGGAGFDTASYRTSALGVRIDLNRTASGGDAQGDVLISIEGLEGSEFRDTLIGSNGNDTIDGLGGDDLIESSNGDDTIRGGAGDDTLRAGNGNDTLSGGNGNDVLDGSNGNDTLFGGADNDTLEGGNGNDVLAGDAGDDRLIAGNGNDTLDGGAGSDRLDGGNGRDTYIFGHAGSDVISNYERGEQIDLRAIQVDFTFIGAAAFSSVAGELRYSNGVIQGDFDGNGIADLNIQLFGSPLNTADLLFA